MNDSNIMSLCCPICQSTAITNDRKIATDQIVRCRDCRLVFSSEPVKDQTEIYTKDYFQGSKSNLGYADYSGEINSHRKTFEYRLKEAENKLAKPGLLLDCGCAYGHFLTVAKERGWKVYGTDICFEAVKQARDSFGVPVFISDLSSAPIKRNSFDLVSLYDVIEHFSNPLQITNQVMKTVKPNGYLHITTPDVGSLSAKILGSRWYHYKPHEHLIYFSKFTLKKMLEEQGLRSLSLSNITSRMEMQDIMKRIRFYSKSLAYFMMKILKFLSLDSATVSIPIGEIQAWAQKSARPHSAEPKTLNKENQTQTSSQNLSKNQRLLSEVVEILSCPACENELDLQIEKSSINCKVCKLAFPVEDDIPIVVLNRAKSLDQIAS